MNIWILSGFVSGIGAIFYFFKRLSVNVAFRELLLLLYIVNYLLAPAIIYTTNSNLVFYNMRVPSEMYFPIAIIGIIGLILGLFTFRSDKLFVPNLSLMKIEAIVNKQILKHWVFAGIALSVFSKFLPSEIAFLIYLFSMIRFIGAFGLFAMDSKRNLSFIILIMFYEFISALRFGMFHDFVMWSIFFILFLVFLKKTSTAKKIYLFVFGLFVLTVIQNAKSSYRATINESGQAKILTFFKSVSNSTTETEYKDYFQSKSFINSVTRVNQGWILSSVIDNTERYQNFQSLNIVAQYLEAAFMPRFLAKDKMKAGSKEIFNTYSGMHINSDTSMGLGVLGDGYVAFGLTGVFLFTFMFGTIFSLIFKIVKSWTKVSPFFFLFLFPIMNYAIRPDCELQTILGHLVKSTLMYGLLIRFYASVFQKKLSALSEVLTPI